MKGHRFYGSDLAYIHDAGFGEYARSAGREIIAMLHARGCTGGQVVDLGCGSGIFIRALVDEGFKAHGIDASPAMIDLARSAVPEATFETGSFFDTDIPPCDAVTSMGECLCYLFDERNSRAMLNELFRRVFSALMPGGIFVFDIIEPGYRKATGPVKRHTMGDDWAVLVHIEEDESTAILERRITTFRRRGTTYVREKETHRVQLYNGKELAEDLRRIGFTVQVRRRYGAFQLSKSHAVLVARKP